MTNRESLLVHLQGLKETKRGREDEEWQTPFFATHVDKCKIIRVTLVTIRFDTITVCYVNSRSPLRR